MAAAGKDDGAEAAAPTRVTIRQVAIHAGVSEAAVSYALNGRPGVSEQTRARVLAAARDLGWAPNIAARSLGTARANAVGLVLVRPPRQMVIDSWFTQMLSGVEAELNRRQIALVLHLVDDIDDTVDVYRKWWAGRHVDGVILTDLRKTDPRLTALLEIGLPAAIIGGSPDPAGFSTVDADVAGTAGAIVGYLRALGHRTVARVAGTEELFHTHQRDLAYTAAVERAGLRYSVLYTNYSAVDGMRAMRELMTGAEPPTAVVFDNDVMAAASLKVVHEMGLSVPDDVSIVAWDDSDLCQITMPSITAVEQTPARQSELAAQALLATLDGGEVRHVTLPPGTLNPRESTRPLRSARR
ncbi:LacI family DNA-binding transcriptional regulator [Dactylosporangium sp. AC04546]|uniref:LacI family DNA-binding transcriptional regulator n=1 Tax=Dactylosporangium sp. AC04546 TaxID=2862460 RepID=UPI001EDF13A1|nr:LacI family DNA-binding transcriptional regulator [Dactylosporangium sp. AC04546]WVK80133.1 LacI family DNA-binding transcriptional regulator [Dactylosporangium sp. AC04546]